MKTVFMTVNGHCGHFRVLAAGMPAPAGHVAAAGQLTG